MAKKKDNTVAIFLAAQVVVVLGVGGWLLLGGSSETDPDGPAAWFHARMASLEKQHTINVQQFLGRDVMRAADESCHRRACIREKYGGNRGKWATASAASGIDACAGYREPACTRDRLVAALQHTLRYVAVYHCTAEDLPRKGKHIAVKVSCGATSDTVRVSELGQGRFAFVGDDRFPGFMPNLFENVATLE